MTGARNYLGRPSQVISKTLASSASSPSRANTNDAIRQLVDLMPGNLNDLWVRAGYVQNAQWRTLDSTFRDLFLIVKRNASTIDISSIKQRSVFTMQKRMQSAGAIRQLSGWASFESNDDRERL